jgi:phosphoglycolate phosphatase-like HAD superfamily hydrolase
MGRKVKNTLVALDGDGVLLDYRRAFPGVWKAAFGSEIQMIQPNAYHAHTAHGIQWESAEQEQHFLSHFGEEAWSTMPLLEGVAEGCQLMVDAGFELVCVTSMNAKFGAARKRNFELHNLPISEVYPVKRVGSENPKLEVLHRLMPIALADDLMDNFDGLSPDIHSAFIDYRRFDSPSLVSRIVPDSTPGSLLEFARFLVAREG